MTPEAKRKLKKNIEELEKIRHQTIKVTEDIEHAFNTALVL